MPEPVHFTNPVEFFYWLTKVPGPLVPDSAEWRALARLLAACLGPHPNDVVALRVRVISWWTAKTYHLEARYTDAHYFRYRFDDETDWDCISKCSSSGDHTFSFTITADDLATPAETFWRNAKKEMGL